MRYSFKTENTCCKLIEFNLDNDIVTNVTFLGGGCPGNLKAIPKLIEGMKINDIIDKISGITCGNKETSCADQLAKALIETIDKVKI